MRKKKVIAFLIHINKKCALVRIYLIVVELNYVNYPILESFVSLTVELDQ